MMKHVRIENILLPPAVSAGMNPYVLMSLCYFYRSDIKDTEPIDLVPVGYGIYRIKDGRHRFFATVMAGRTSVLANILDE